MDGDSRGGAALSVKAVSGKAIKFVGTGEKLENFAPFDARAFVDALFQAE